MSMIEKRKFFISPYYTVFPAYPGKRLDRPVTVLPGMSGRELHPDPGRSPGNDRIKEPDDVYSLIEQVRREILRQLCVVFESPVTLSARLDEHPA